MSEIIKTIFDVQTNELEVRPMTNDELAQYETDKINAIAKAQAEADAAQAKAALLKRLGITAEEAKLLLS